MSKHIVNYIDNTLIEKIRGSHRDAFGNSLSIDIAKSERSICRVCLKRFKVGDQRLLFLYNPYRHISIHAEIGPIFIHSDSCVPAQICGEKTDVFSLPLVFKALDENNLVLNAKIVVNNVNALNDFFKETKADKVHIRDAEYGCFISEVIEELSAG